MSSDIDKNQNRTDFVSEVQFNQVISTFLTNRDEKGKPLWTRERIDEAVTLVEQFKSSPQLKLQRTNKHYYYGRKYDVMEVGNQKLLILKRKSESDAVVIIVPMESFYHVLREVHQLTGHGGRDKMLCVLKSKYLIPTSVVLEFLKLCRVCQTKRTFPIKGITPAASTVFNHRGHIHLIDMQSTPDGQYKWLLHYQDEATKFTFLRPLASKAASEIANELLKIFLDVGCPHILQSDDHPDFTNSVIRELTRLWPACRLLNGTLTLPGAQDHVDQTLQDVKDMLHTWLKDNNTYNWSLGCHFVQFRRNSTFDESIQQSPYKTLFRLEPRLGNQSSQASLRDMPDRLAAEEDSDSFSNETDNESGDEAPEDLRIGAASLRDKDCASTSDDGVSVKSSGNRNSYHDDDDDGDDGGSNDGALDLILDKAKRRKS